jgi:cytoskeletal protein RodZ
MGAALRERREAMGVSLAEVEVATRIRQKYLSAIESEEWHMLPGEVVGRGFLRNYADYLGLDPQEIMERRRATTGTGMTQALSTTSAGAPLPPEREVDYRPKEVELKDEGDGIQRGEIRLTPILAIIAVAIAVGLGLWGLSTLREPIGEILADAQAGVMGLFEPGEDDETDEPQATPSDLSAAVVNEQNVAQSQAAAMAATATAAAQGVVTLGSAGTTPDAAAPNAVGAEGTVQEGTAPEAPAEAAPVEGAAEPVEPAAEAPANPAGDLILVPTATPEQAAVAPVVEQPAAVVEAPTAAPALPTATPVPPTPTLEPPTATPVLPPTEAPTPEPPPAPVVAAPACGDPRSVISAPGVGQALAGVTAISGVATHESFQFYKLEFAAGANAGGGFTYFGGGQVQIAGGVLGNLDTTVLPNGEYTIRLTVVDQVGNFPPPCDVSVVVQN